MLTFYETISIIIKKIRISCLWQAGETNLKFNYQNSKLLFVWNIFISNI